MTLSRYAIGLSALASSGTALAQSGGSMTYGPAVAAAPPAAGAVIPVPVPSLFLLPMGIALAWLGYRAIRKHGLGSVLGALLLALGLGFSLASSLHIQRAIAAALVQLDQPGGGTVNIPLGDAIYTNTSGVALEIGTVVAPPSCATTAPADECVSGLVLEDTESCSTVYDCTQTISFTSTPPTFAGVPGAYEVAATATSGLDVVFSTASAACSIVGTSTVRFEALGTCVINADQGGDADFSAAPQVQQSIQITDISDVTPTKTTTIAGVDAGDQVVYTIVLSNASGADVDTVYDIRVMEVLDTNLELISLSVSGATLIAGGSSSSLLDITLDQLGPGDSATIILNGRVRSSVVSGSTVSSPATTYWTSLEPGPGDSQSEWAAYPSADFVIARPTIDKLTPSDTTYAIGELVTWDILVTVPEGVTNDLVVTDNLPPGIFYEGFQVVTSAAGSGGLLANNYAGTVTAVPTVTNPSGNARQFNFGQVAGTADLDNLPANNTFLLRVTGRVNNSLANQGSGSPSTATTLSNTASLQYTDGTNGSSTVNDPTPPGPVTIVEPVMSLDKAALTLTTPLYAGSTVQFQVAFSNSGTSTSHDLQFTDALPDGLIVESIELVSSVGGASADIAVSGVGTHTLTGEFTVPVGGSVTVVYTARLEDTVIPDTNYTNDVDITWSSLDGANANERTGVDGLQDDGSFNDYRLEDSVTVSTGLVP